MLLLLVTSVGILSLFNLYAVSLFSNQSVTLFYIGTINKINYLNNMKIKYISLYYAFQNFAQF